MLGMHQGAFVNVVRDQVCTSWLAIPLRHMNL